MAEIAEDQQLLDLIGLYEDQDEATIWARRVGWANEGLTPDQVEEWTDTREGALFYVATIGGVREDARIYDLMGTEVIAASTPLLAWETYLDYHAEVQNLLRNAAVAATGSVTFGGDEGVVIAAGAVVGVEPADPDLPAPEFETLAPVTITGGEATVAVRASEGGKAGEVAAHAITALLTVPPGVNTVDNAAPTVGGTDTETDEELRARLLAVFGAGGGGWNQEDYKLVGLAYGNGIGRVTVIPLWNGPGSVKVILATADGGPVSSTVVDDFQAFIDPMVGTGAGEAMVGATVTVQTVDLLAIVVAATVEFEEGYSLDGATGTIALREFITTRLREYVNAVSSGDEVVHQRVVAVIAGTRGVHDVGGVTINGGTGNVAVSGGATPQSPRLTEPVDLTEGDV
jgi:uncharacterized phage protein gp47/JayE